MQHTLTANDWQGKPQFVHVEGEHLQTIAIEGAHEINLFREFADDDLDGQRFTVSYGLEVTKGLGTLRAMDKIGECVFHALACVGKLD